MSMNNGVDKTRLLKSLERILAGRGEKVTFTWKGKEEHVQDRLDTSEHCNLGSVHHDE